MDDISENGIFKLLFYKFIEDYKVSKDTALLCVTLICKTNDITYALGEINERLLELNEK